MKVLVIRFSSIGDILMTTPVLRCLKRQLPDLELHFLTKQKFHFVLKSNSYIDKFHLLKDDLKKVVHELKQEDFDYVVDLHHNLRSLRVKKALGKPSSAYFKANIEKWLMVNFKIDRLPGTHTSGRFLKTLEPLGVKDDGEGLDYFFEQDYAIDTLLPPSHRRHYIGFIIGGSYYTRRMPPEKIIAIINKLDQPVVLLGGPEDRERGDLISHSCGSKVYNACGQYSFDQSAFLVKCADQIITHDTSLMHVAAAFDKNIIAVYGHNVPEFGNYPFRVTNSEIIGIEGLSCRPCSKNGTAKCPKGHFRCMLDIDENLVAKLANHS